MEQNRYFKIVIIILLFLTIVVQYSTAGEYPGSSILESSLLMQQLTETPGLDNEENQSESENKPKYHFFGQSLCLFFPIIEERIKENNEIERNIYPIGIGGGLEYRVNILKSLFSSPAARPGMILGLALTFYMMEPQEIYQDNFGELTILTAGLYTGYQFNIPVSGSLSISPLIYAGGRYYVSFHFFEEEISTAYNPIIISGLDIGIIFNNSFSLSIRAEYQMYVEEEVKQIINLFIGSGIYF
jgi:hypothetical protein